MPTMACRGCNSAPQQTNCEDNFMQNIRIVAIDTEVAEQVRATRKSPTYGFPAQLEVAEDVAPCRHCLRTIAPKDRRILFTYDRFTGKESLPQPGPVYIHADGCQQLSRKRRLPRGAARKPAHRGSLCARPKTQRPGIRSG